MENRMTIITVILAVMCFGSFIFAGAEKRTIEQERQDFTARIDKMKSSDQSVDINNGAQLREIQNALGKMQNCEAVK